MSRTSTRTVYAVSLVLLSAGLLVLSLGGYLDPAQDFALRPISGVQAWLSLRFTAIRDLITAPADLAASQQRIAELEAENARLQQQIIQLQQQAAEADVLAALLNYARSQPTSRYLAANVIGRDVSPFLRSIWIDRGSDHGLVKGMPVVTQRGLVGRLAEVYGTAARVELITDPHSAVNVRLHAAGYDGVVTAQVNGELWVDLISQDASVTEGELALTSGLGGGYPPDIPVGRVISVRRRDYELFQQAIIQPAVDFERLEIVLVITNYRPLPLQGSPP